MTNVVVFSVMRRMAGRSQTYWPFFVVSEKAQYNIRSHLVVVVQRSTFDKDRKKNRRDGQIFFQIYEGKTFKDLFKYTIK